jgi:hypothetical protein
VDGGGRCNAAVVWWKRRRVGVVEVLVAGDGRPVGAVSRGGRQRDVAAWGVHRGGHLASVGCRSVGGVVGGSACQSAFGVVYVGRDSAGGAVACRRSAEVKPGVW